MDLKPQWHSGSSLDTALKQISYNPFPTLRMSLEGCHMMSLVGCHTMSLARCHMIPLAGCHIMSLARCHMLLLATCFPSACRKLCNKVLKSSILGKGLTFSPPRLILQRKLHPQLKLNGSERVRLRQDTASFLWFMVSTG